MTPKLVKPKGTSKADASSSRPPVQQSIEQPTMDEEKHTPPRKEAKGDLAHDLINEMLASVCDSSIPFLFLDVICYLFPSDCNLRDR